MDQIKHIRMMQHRKYLLANIYSGFNRNQEHNYSCIQEYFEDKLINKRDGYRINEKLVLLSSDNFDLYRIYEFNDRKVPDLDVNALVFNKNDYDFDEIDDNYFYEIDDDDLDEDTKLALMLSRELENTSPPETQIITHKLPNKEIYVNYITDAITSHYEKIDNVNSVVLFDIDKCANYNGFEYETNLIIIKPEVRITIQKAKDSGTFDKLSSLFQ